MTRRYRLRGALAFDAVFRAGRRFEGSKVQLFAAPAAGDIGRVGYIIGSRQLKRAIDRNRLKRMLRAAIASRRERLNAFDLVLRLRHPCTRDDLSSAAAEAARLLDSLPVSVEPAEESAEQSTKRSTVVAARSREAQS